MYGNEKKFFGQAENLQIIFGQNRNFDKCHRNILRVLVYISFKIKILLNNCEFIKIFYKLE